MTHRLKRFLFIGILVSFSQQVNAQDPTVYSNKFIPQSPTAASIHKFNEIPVSMYTGTANVTVPLFELPSHQLSLPIVLKYHSSGLKVGEYASWVGAGWALDPAGAISRTIRGLPDENPGTSGLHQGFFRNGHLYDSNGNINTIYIESCDEEFAGIPIGPVNTVDSVAQGLLDIEPDLYFLSAPGLSGKFAFSQDRTVTPFLLDDIEIVDHPFENSIPNGTGLYSWKVKGPDGTNYVFDKKEIVAQGSTCNSQIPSYGYLTSSQNAWYLTSMSLNGDTIWFDYASEIYEHKVRMSESKKIKIGGGAGPDGSPTICFAAYDVTGWRLDKITTSSGYKAQFYANTNRLDMTGAKRLDSVKIFMNNEVVKNWHLNYGYFGSNDKLKLVSVEEVDHSNTNSIPSHQFTYFEIGSFPEMNSLKQDYWGYYNGASGNTTSLIPQFKTDAFHLNRQSAVNREPSLINTKLGTLEKITYPTGGYSVFTYELNTYYEPNYKKTYYAQAHADGSVAPDTVLFNFTIDSACSATIDYDTYLSDFDGITELRKKSGGVYSIYTPTFVNAYNSRVSLPTGDYQLYAASNTAREKFIDVEYEQQEVNLHKEAGGLRIAKITYYDSNDTRQLEKKYAYSEDFTESVHDFLVDKKSSGVLFTPILLGHEKKTTHTVQIIDNNGNCLFQSITDYISLQGQSQAPMSLSNGSHIGYSKVHEFQTEHIEGEGATKVLGQKTFEYINDKPTNNYVFPYVPLRDMGYQNGKPTVESIFYYDAVNDTLYPQNIRKSFYTTITETSSEIEGYNYFIDESSTCYECRSGESNIYRVTPTWHRLDSVVDINYLNLQTSLTTSTKYGYSSLHHQLATVRNYLDDDRGELEVYTRDSNNPALVKERGIFSTAHNDWINSSQIAGDSVVYHGKIPDKVYRFDPASDTYELILDRNFEDNRVVEVIQHPDSDDPIYTTYLWAYDGTHVVAELTNTKASDVNTTTKNSLKTESTNLQIKNLLYTVESNLSSISRIKKYLYDDRGQLAEVIDENGFLTTYNYDDFGRLQVIKDPDGKILKYITYKYKGDEQ